MASLTTTHVCSWGIDYSKYDKAAFLSGASGGNGILYGVDESTEPIMAPEHNELGQVIAQTNYDMHGRISGTLQVAHGLSLPTAGQVVTINGSAYYLASASLSESNQAYDKYAVTFERYLRTSGSAFVVHPTGWNT